MAKPIKILGISGDVTACDCCGKQDLKRTVCVLDYEEESVKFLGTTCASNAINARRGNFHESSASVVRVATAREVAKKFAFVVQHEASKRKVTA